MLESLNGQCVHKAQKRKSRVGDFTLRRTFSDDLVGSFCVSITRIVAQNDCCLQKRYKYLCCLFNVSLMARKLIQLRIVAS